MNTPVSFEIAKLLKEKGYSSITEDPIYYYTDEVNNIEEHQLKNQNDLYYADFGFTLLEDDYPAPIIAQVIMWLYEKHKLFIILYPYDEFREDIFSFCIIKRSGNYKDKFPYRTPTEAYAAAIKYTLNNLI